MERTVCWSPSAKREACQLSKMQNLRRMDKNYSPIWSRLWTKAHDIFRQCRRPFILSNALARLSIRFIHKLFATKSRSRRKPNKCKSFWPPIFFEKTVQIVLRQIVSASSTVWHSLVEFRLLISVCDAWQWRETQHFRRVGKNCGPVWSRLWTKVHVALRRCRRLPIVVNALSRLSLSCFV